MSKYLLALLISLTTSGAFAHNCGGYKEDSNKKVEKEAENKSSETAKIQYE